MAWSDLTHKTHHEWRLQGLQSQKLLLLLSGGVDSLALFSLLCDLARPLEFEFSVLHFHHGGESAARQEALSFCRRLCEQKRVPFFSLRAHLALESEQEMREFRREAAARLATCEQFDRILTAHQADDVLETRLFRVLRGTGLQGVQALKSFDSPWWRPLLERSRQELVQDLAWRGLEPLKDPTNEDQKYRRNWIRHELLPKIEAKMPGAAEHLARFFSQVVESERVHSVTNDRDSREWVQSGIPRTWFLQRSASEQKQALASYLFVLGVKDYRYSQIEEVRKHLDNPKIVHTFRTAGCEWILNQDVVRAFPGERA
ncbi:MAG: tRNA lysidine(34) synthetase TilS [Bdellovibrio sp.]|jgi:tRNA(Ile)-lysidine synthase